MSLIPESSGARQILGALLLVALFATGYFVIPNLHIDRTAYVIAGNIASTDEDTLNVDGYVSAPGEPAPEAPKTFSIHVPRRAEIQRITFEIPSGNEVFYPEKLPRDTQNVDFPSLQRDVTGTQRVIGVRVEVRKKVSKWEASKIEYTFPRN